MTMLMFSQNYPRLVLLVWLIKGEASRAYGHTWTGIREQRSISTQFLILTRHVSDKENAYTRKCTRTRMHTHTHTHTYAHTTQARTHRATARAASTAALEHLVLHVKSGTGCDQLGYCLCMTVQARDHQRRIPIVQRQQAARRASDATPPVTGARVSLDCAVVPCSSGAHTYMYIHKRMPVGRNEYVRT